jgi:hypothetical protein
VGDEEHRWEEGGKCGSDGQGLCVCRGKRGPLGSANEDLHTHTHTHTYTHTHKLTLFTVPFNSFTALSTCCSLPKTNIFSASPSPMASLWAYCTALSRSRRILLASLAAVMMLVVREEGERRALTASRAWFRLSSRDSIVCVGGAVSVCVFVSVLGVCVCVGV